MKKNILSAAFALALAIDIIDVATKNNIVQLVCKPLLLLLLIAFFHQSLRENNSGLKKWIFLALIFSWIGDVLLLFQDREELFFLLGLSAFLLAHIFYIIFFHKVRLYERVQSKPSHSSLSSSITDCWSPCYRRHLVQWNCRLGFTVSSSVLCLCWPCICYTFDQKGPGCGWWQVHYYLLFQTRHWLLINFTGRLNLLVRLSCLPTALPNGWSRRGPYCISVKPV